MLYDLGPRGWDLLLCLKFETTKKIDSFLIGSYVQGAANENHFHITKSLFFHFVKKENQIISQNHLTQKSENHKITKSSLKEMLDDFISTNQ